MQVQNEIMRLSVCIVVLLILPVVGYILHFLVVILNNIKFCFEVHSQSDSKKADVVEALKKFVGVMESIIGKMEKRENKPQTSDEDDYSKNLTSKTYCFEKF